MIEPTPSNEMVPMYEPRMTESSAEMPFEFGGEELDLNLLAEGEGLPETGPGFDGLPERTEGDDWDLSELNQNFNQELPMPEINRQVESVRKTVANPPLEGIINQLYSEQFPITHEHALGFEGLEVSESDALNEYGFFLQDQHTVQSLLTEDFIESDLTTASVPMAPRQTEIPDVQGATHSDKKPMLSDEFVAFSVPTSTGPSEVHANDQAAASVEVGIDPSVITPEISLEAVPQPEHQPLPEITSEQVAEVVGKYNLNIQPELQGIISEEIAAQYQELVETQPELFMSIEQQTAVLASPERHETLKTFDLKTEVVTTLEPQEQFKQHLKELTRLIAILIRYDSGIANNGSETASFTYEGELSDLDELMATIEDQFVMAVATKLLTEYQDNLQEFQRAIEEVFDDYYDQLLVDLGGDETADQLTWSDAAARLNLADVEDVSLMEITHEIREDNTKALVITFPTLKGEYEPDETTTLSAQPLPQRLEKETRITPSNLAN